MVYTHELAWCRLLIAQCSCASRQLYERQGSRHSGKVASAHLCSLACCFLGLNGRQASSFQGNCLLLGHILLCLDVGYGPCYGGILRSTCGLSNEHQDG